MFQSVFIGLNSTVTHYRAKIVSKNKVLDDYLGAFFVLQNFVVMKSDGRLVTIAF